MSLFATPVGDHKVGGARAGPVQARQAPGADHAVGGARTSDPSPQPVLVSTPERQLAAGNTKRKGGWCMRGTAPSATQRGRQVSNVGPYCARAAAANPQGFAAAAKLTSKGGEAGNVGLDRPTHKPLYRASFIDKGSPKQVEARYIPNTRGSGNLCLDLPPRGSSTPIPLMGVHTVCTLSREAQYRVLRMVTTLA